MKKNLLTTLLVLVCVFALLLAGCGGGNDSANDSANQNVVSDNAAAENAGSDDTGSGVAEGHLSSHEEDGTDPIELGFVLYDWTDDQGTYLESYLNYLAENMNIKVECVSYTDSAEDMIDVIESLCSKGVDGIAVASNDGFQSWAQICEDNEVYCSIMLGCLADEDDREFAAGLDYYLGSLGNEDYSFLGEAYADFIIAQGYENVLIAGPSEGLQDQADQMVAASVAKLTEAGVNLEVVRTAWSELFGSCAAAVAGADYDAMYLPLSVMSFGVPQIYSNNLVGKTVAMGHGTADSMADALNSGIVAMFSDNMTCSVGVNVALMVNAIEGNVYPDWPQDVYVNIVSPTFIIDSMEDFEVYSTYVRNFETPVYCLNSDAVKNMIVSYNAGATYAQIVDTIENLTIDNVSELNN